VTDGGRLRVRRAIFVIVLVALVVTGAWVGLVKMKKPAGPGQVAEPKSVRTVTLYFGSTDARSLVPEYRDVAASDKLLDNLRVLVEALISGPTGSAVGLFPRAVTVRGVYINGKTAYIDFSRELIGDFAGGSAGEYLLVASLVQTICANFPEVASVVVLVGGEEVNTIGGHLDVSKPLSPKDWR
jgi:spore germination protein GerM